MPKQLAKWLRGNSFGCTVASKWLVALKQPEQAHTGFEVVLESQHCQFEFAVALRYLQSSYFERTVAAKWLQSNLLST